MKQDFDFDSLKKNWPSAIVARTKISDFTGGLVSSGTLANADSEGTGPSERFYLGKKVAYGVDSLIEWLKSRAQQTRPQNPRANRRQR